MKKGFKTFGWVIAGMVGLAVITNMCAGDENAKNKVSETKDTTTTKPIEEKKAMRL